MTTESMRSDPENSFGQTSAERYRSLVEDTSDGFYAVNAVSGRFVFLNRRGCDLLGYSLQEAGRLKAWEVVVPAEHRRFKENLRALLSGEAPKPKRQIFTALRKDLTTFSVELSMEVADLRGQPFVQGVLRDVTDYEQYKKQIDHFQRMETIATIVGGLSNQFGNAITVIRSNVTKLKQLCAGEEQPTRHLAQIRGALHRLDGLTQYMLAFSRGVDQLQRSDRHPFYNQSVRKPAYHQGRYHSSADGADGSCRQCRGGHRGSGTHCHFDA